MKGNMGQKDRSKGKAQPEKGVCHQVTTVGPGVGVEGKNLHHPAQQQGTGDSQQGTNPTRGEHLPLRVSPAWWLPKALRCILWAAGDPKVRPDTT
jgi:hypothetical protein